RLRLLARDVDRALARELRVVEVEDLVVEALERPLGQRDEPDRQVEARQPGGGLDQVSEVLEVEPDVPPVANGAAGGNDPDDRIGRRAWSSTSSNISRDSSGLPTGR